MEHYSPIRDRETEIMRQEFAKAAMQGLLSNDMFMHGLQQRISNDDTIPEYIASASVQMADALIEELKH